MTIWKCLKVSAVHSSDTFIRCMAVGQKFPLISYLLAYIASSKGQSESALRKKKSIFSRGKGIALGKVYKYLLSTDMYILPVLCAWCHTSSFSHILCLCPYYLPFFSELHLVFLFLRIALQEETNRMSANALAIVFAPCILRCPDTIDPLQSVQDISKTTT